MECGSERKSYTSTTGAGGPPRSTAGLKAPSPRRKKTNPDVGFSWQLQGFLCIETRAGPLGTTVPLNSCSRSHLNPSSALWSLSLQIPCSRAQQGTASLSELFCRIDGRWRRGESPVSSPAHWMFDEYDVGTNPRMVMIRRIVFWLDQ